MVGTTVNGKSQGETDPLGRGAGGVKTSAGETRFKFYANHVALDLVNTVQNRLSAKPDRDLLITVDDLLRWLEASGLAEGNSVLGKARAEGEEGHRAALAEARRLRGALWKLFYALSKGDAPPAGAIAELNRVLALGARFRQVRVTDGGALVDAEARGTSALLGRVVSVAEAAADLLGSGRLSRVRKCARPECAGLFYDTSKSGRRRWCIMGLCGNRAKVARYHERHGGR
jgi:predicted RNA-binding Zn ribbon-like protein